VSDLELKALKNELAELAASFKSANQLALAKGLAAGKSQEQAYIEAGYKSKKPAVDASKLIQSNPRFTRYREVFLKIAQIELTPKQIATFEQKTQLLWSMALHDSAKVAKGGDDGDGDLAHRDARSAIAAIAELNKMQGDLAAIKTDNTHSFAEELNDEQLDKRIAQLQAQAGVGATS
jgi:hypothetical protein